MVLSDSFDYVHGVQEGRFSLDTLNSLTKYPSILTYHTLGAKGVLREPAMQFVGEVEVTEKVDGTNARLIVLPDGMVVVGSREELLYATGDLIHNPALGIVQALKDQAVIVSARAQLGAPDTIRVIYGEVYGDGVGPAGKMYSAGTKGLTGFRVFDVASVPVEALVWSKEQAAGWRDRGGQKYESATVVDATAQVLNVMRVPRVGLVDGSQMPTSIEQTSHWLKMFAPRSRVALAHKDGALVKAEGVVVRGTDSEGNRLLGKIRYEDYERTQRALEKPQRERRPSMPLARKIS